MQLFIKKSMSIIATALVLSFSAGAQSLEEGIKMVRYERYSSAEKILQPMAASGNAVANYYLGIAQLNNDNKEAARATFSKFPDDAANMAGMARLAYASGNAAEGDRLTKAVIEKAKKKDWLPYYYAAEAINNGGGNIQDAINYYTEAMKRGGDNVDVRIGLGDAFQKIQGGGGKSMDNYEAATTKDAKNSLGYSRIGALWYAAHNYNDALTNYAKAKDADPANPIPYSDLANAYFYVGKFDLAKQNIEQYLKLSDQSCDDKIRYANILFLAKDYPTAIAKMQEVIGSCGERPYMYNVLGRSQYETKDYDNAVQNMRTYFSKQDPKKITPDDYLYMGKILGAQKQADSSDYYFTRAISSDTTANKRKVYLDLADVYKGMNTEAGYAKAADYYKKAIDASGEAATATDYFYWGYYNYYAKRYDQAAKTFETMESKFPDQPSATYWRARVAAAVDNEGKTGGAASLFNKWLAIPDTDAYKHKPADQNIAYQYLAIVSYNKNDKTATRDYIAKIKAINPTDPLAKQLEDLLNKPSKPAATPAKPKK